MTRKPLLCRQTLPTGGWSRARFSSIQPCRFKGAESVTTDLLSRGAGHTRSVPRLPRRRQPLAAAGPGSHNRPARLLTGSIRMRRTLLCLAGLVVFLTAGRAADTDPEPNKPPKGFIALFNGKD